MCLAVPGKVVEIMDQGGLRMGKIDYSGTVQLACLDLIPDIRIGEYTVVHAGFALSVIDEEEAMKSLAVWHELIEANRERGMDIYGNPLPEGDQGGGDEIPR